ALILGRHVQNFFHALAGGQVEKLLRLEIGQPAIFAAPHLVGVGGLGAVSGDGASSVFTVTHRRGAFGRFFFAFLLVFVTLVLGFVNRALRGIARERGFAVGDLLDHLFGWKVFDDLFGVHTQRTELTKPGLERHVIHSVGMEFELDPLVNAHLSDALYV